MSDTKLRGQLRYVVAQQEGDREKYWRSRGNQHQPGHWTWSLSDCHKYRSAADASRAATQLSEAGTLEVRELTLVVGRVCARVTVEEA